MSKGVYFVFMTGNKDEKNASLWWLVGIAWEMGYMIAIPLVGFALLGRFVDKKMQTSPLFLLISIGLAIMISTILVIKKTREALDAVEDEAEKKKNH